MTAPKLTKAQQEMLEQCALAERFTSKSLSISRAQQTVAIKSLERAGLIKWAPGWRLTPAGREALKGGAR